MTAEEELVRAKSEFHAAFKRHAAAQERHWRETVLPEMKKKVGMCYRYRSSYSCSIKRSDYWYIYARIVGIKDEAFRLLEVQRDSYGRVRVEFNTNCTAFDGTLYSGYEPISRTEYSRGVARVTTAIAAMLAE